MKIALITEGTYPYVHGGVSMWCDRLMRKIPEIEFTVYAIAPAVGSDPVWELPPNVSSLEAIELEPTMGRGFERYPLEVQQRFLAAFDGFLLSILSAPTPNEDEFLAALLAKY